MATRHYDELDFSVFLMHRLAEAWGTGVPEVYRTLSSTGILNGYIIPCYDTLHSMGTEALVADITAFARERGATV